VKKDVKFKERESRHNRRGGMVAEMHLKNFVGNEAVHVSWLCDKIEGTLKNGLNKYNIHNGTKDYKEILSDRKVNAVLICTPPSSHYKIGICT
jgi:predicted dehydrogenase